MQTIIVRNVTKDFRIGYRRRESVLKHFIQLFSGNIPKKTISVLKNISFSAAEGEVVGIIGKNGSGKSTLLRVIAGVYTADKGIVKTNGKVISLLNLGVGLKERLTMKDNIYLLCALFGMGKKETKKSVPKIIEFSGLRNFLNTQVFQFSQGMIQRLVFSVAIHSNPKILLLDEVFEGSDEDFKKKSAAAIKRLVKNGATATLVSQDMILIKKYCDRVFLLKNGRIKEFAKNKIFTGID